MPYIFDNTWPSQWLGNQTYGKPVSHPYVLRMIACRPRPARKNQIPIIIHSLPDLSISSNVSCHPPSLFTGGNSILTRSRSTNSATCYMTDIHNTIQTSTLNTRQRQRQPQPPPGGDRYIDDGRGWTGGQCGRRKKEQKQRQKGSRI